MTSSTADDVFLGFGQHVLAFDVTAAAQYAKIVDHRDEAGAPIDGFDA